MNIQKKKSSQMNSLDEHTERNDFLQKIYILPTPIVEAMYWLDKRTERNYFPEVEVGRRPTMDVLRESTWSGGKLDDLQQIYKLMSFS